MADEPEQIQLNPDALIGKLAQQLAGAAVTIAKLELALEQVTAERNDLLAIANHPPGIRGEDTGLGVMAPEH
jgi:hypothetical protein